MPGRLERLLRLREVTGIGLTLVCHRPHQPTALHRALHTVPHTVTSDLDIARSHYYDGAPTAPAGIPEPAFLPRTPTARWITLPALDRLVSYDVIRPCTGPCAPAPIAWKQRPSPRPLTDAAAQETTRRIHRATAHPRLAAALIATLLTGASFQQLLTVRTEDLDQAAATVAFHDPARYTDGCATYPVLPWARPFLRAAGCFAALTGSRELLACQDERPHILRLAENAKL
jgi:integrase